jgi:hypothetical protein
MWPRVGVLYVDGEMHIADIQDRVRLMLDAVPEIDRVTTPHPCHGPPNSVEQHGCFCQRQRRAKIGLLYYKHSMRGHSEARQPALRRDRLAPAADPLGSDTAKAATYVQADIPGNRGPRLRARCESELGAAAGVVLVTLARYAR